VASDIIVIERSLLKSQPFRGLGSKSKDVYFDFLMKCRIGKTKPKPGRAAERVILNNGKIEYCYSEAEVKGISRKQFRNAIDELIHYGFIDIAHLGTGGHKGDKNTYSISDRWQSWGTDKFIAKHRPKDGRQGRGWAVYNQKRNSNIGVQKDTPSSVQKDTPRYKNKIVGVSKRTLEKKAKNGWNPYQL
jgi:hypothetical protein